MAEEEAIGELMNYEVQNGGVTRAAYNQISEVRGPGQRYRGRSAARPQSEPKYVQPQHSQPRVIPMQREHRQPAQPEARTTAAPWSLRLALALLGMISLIIATRAMAGFPPPVDAPVGIEATHAAFVRLLTNSGTEGGYIRASMPWQGVAPVDPLSGIPVYSWLAAAIASLTGVDLAGRLIGLVFSVVAGLALFFLVQRTAGARAAVYASVLYVVAPLSVVFGRHYSPASLLLFLQATVMLLLVKWRATSTLDRPGGSALALSAALAAAFVYGLVDSASAFLAVPALFLFVTPPTNFAMSKPAIRRLGSARDHLSASANRGKFYLYLGVLALGSAAWQVFRAGSASSFHATSVDSFSLGSAILSLFAATTYLQVVGGLVGHITGMIGLLLLGAGLLAGARGHHRFLFHAWLGASMVHVVLDGGRLLRYEDALLPLLMPACALVGIGAAWSASFPARIWLAITERNKLTDDEYSVSPHTAWLLDVPEERLLQERPSRPQAQLALGKNLADRSRSAGRRARRASLVLGGHAFVAACFVLFLTNNWEAASAGNSLSAGGQELLIAGQDLNAYTSPGSTIIIVGPSAPELFYASERTGWAMALDEFNMSEVQKLQRAGAAYLLSTDQDWLGRHADYMGLLANYSVARLTRQYILFDLNAKPAANDRLYFLESGHTLGGEFRRFWESHGGVQRLGYPITEEYQDVNPLDGQTRTVQYFERAVLELHPEKQGTADVVMIAAAGRWVTRDRDFPRIAPFRSTSDNVYFAETGHSLKEAFLRFWLREGGLAQFGYPISEELPEISLADGKVYTVQYFERARFEWHPTEAGTPGEVQLGLIGKQALEMRK